LVCAFALVRSIAVPASAQDTLLGRTEIAAGAQPQLVVASDGRRAWLAYGQGKDVLVARSEDGGSTFLPPVKVASLPSLMLGMRRGPRIAAHGDQVMLAVNAGDLLAYSSADAGATWSAPVIINDIPGSAREGLHDLAVGPDGRFFAVWLDLRLGKMALATAESGEGGRTWGANSVLYRSPEVSICECCHPTAHYDSAGNLAVMWRNWLGGSRDLWSVTRPAGMAQFGAPVKQGAGTWTLKGCPMDGGDLIARGGSFDSVWQRDGSVYLQSGEAPEVRIAAGKQPVAVPVGTSTWIVWQDGADLRSLAVGAGHVVAAPKLVATGARFPSVVALHAGGVLLAYEQAGGVVVERR
jgi:hypothetical protein